MDHPTEIECEIRGLVDWKIPPEFVIFHVND